MIDQKNVKDKLSTGPTPEPKEAYRFVFKKKREMPKNSYFGQEAADRDYIEQRSEELSKDYMENSHKLLPK